MAGASFHSVIRYIHRCIGRPDAGGRTDAELLERFAAQHEEGAFAILVRRHGPLVWNVCRRVLGDGPDAEDAFQAAFLVLVRKAGAIRQPELLANWLYGVACRTARKTKADTFRRQAHERKAASMSEARESGEGAWADLQPVLDEELERLPVKYRAPLVLCYLQGLSYVEAAAQLGWSRGTVSGRLVRARELLRHRLTRRGVVLSSSWFVTVMTQNARGAEVPGPLVLSTIQAAGGFAAGSAAAASVVSARVAALTEGVLQTMGLSKLKVATLGLLALGLAGTAAGVLAHQTILSNPPIAQAGEQPGAKQTVEDRAPDVRAGVPVPEEDTASSKAAAGWKARFTLRGHRGGIRGVAVAPDGKTAVTAGDDSTARLWDLVNGKEAATLEGHKGPVQAVAFSPDGMTVASGGSDGLVKLWDAATGKEQATLAAHKPLVLCLAFSPDGKLLATGSHDMTAKLWDVATGKEQASLQGHRGSVVALGFSPDGQFLATGGNDAAIMLWTVATKQERNTLPGHKGPILALAFAPDGKSLASSASGDQAVKLWDLAMFKELPAPMPEAKRPILALAFSPDGKTLATALGATVKLSDLATATERAALESEAREGQGGITSLAFSRDGKTVLAGTREWTLKVWELSEK